MRCWLRLRLKKRDDGSDRFKLFLRPSGQGCRENLKVGCVAGLVLYPAESGEGLVHSGNDAPLPDSAPWVQPTVSDVLV